MIHNIDAIYDDGVFRPLVPLALPQGARVQLRVEEEDGRGGPAIDYRAWLNGLAGRWQGEFMRDNEGEFESREPLS